MNPGPALWKNFRFWTLHVSLNAAPGFIIACDLARENRGLRIAGMIPGIILFIAGCTLITSSSWFRRTVGHGLFSKALKLATRIRSSISGIGLIGALASAADQKLIFPAYLWILDFYAGFFSSQMVNGFGKLTPIRNLRIFLTGDVPEERAKSAWLGGMDSIVPTFLTTVAEGLVLSVVILLLAGIIHLAAKARNKRRQENPPPSTPGV